MVQLPADGGGELATHGEELVVTNCNGSSLVILLMLTNGEELMVSNGE